MVSKSHRGGHGWLFVAIYFPNILLSEAVRPLRHVEDASRGTLSSTAGSAVETEITDLRPLWPLSAVILTAKELDSSGRSVNLKNRLDSLDIPYRVQDGDYAGRYGSLLEQFEELALEPHVRSAWVEGRSQNDILGQDLVGNADVFCDVAACLKTPRCICIREPKALPADSLLSIGETHRRAWQSIANDSRIADHDWHLILEDDAEVLPSASPDYFRGFNVPTDADLVWLYKGAYQSRCWQDEENVLMSGPVFNTSDYNGVAYAISKAGAQRLLNSVQRDGSPVDVAMSGAIGNCGLKAFCPPQGRYPVTDSHFQPNTTKLLIPKDNFELDDAVAPSFLQLTATGHAAYHHERTLEPSIDHGAASLPRRRVLCGESSSTSI